MRTKNPMRGLLCYFYYPAKGNIVIIFTAIIILAAVAITTGHELAYNAFVMIGIAGLPYTIILSMGGKSYPRWERFQLTMPVRRRHLIGSQYLCILLTSIVGIPFVLLGTWLCFNYQEALFEYNLLIALVNILPVLGMPLILAGVLFPLASTKFGENKGEIFFGIGIAVAFGTNMLVGWVGNRLEWAVGIISIAAFAVAVVVFVASHYITSRIYAKMDF